MTNRKYLLFAVAGAVSGILQWPFVNGPSWLMPSWLSPDVYLIAPGLIFAVCMIVATMLSRHEPIRSGLSLRNVLGAIVLTVGMPIALLGGARSMMIDGIIPGNKFRLGRIALSVFLSAVVSCIVWSFVMTMWTVIVNKARARRVMQTALLVTCSVVVLATLVETISKSISQKSFFWVVVSFGEVIGSAIVLAASCGSHAWHIKDVNRAERERNECL